MAGGSAVIDVGATGVVLDPHAAANSLTEAARMSYARVQIPDIVDWVVEYDSTGAIWLVSQVAWYRYSSHSTNSHIEVLQPLLLICQETSLLQTSSKYITVYQFASVARNEHCPCPVALLERLVATLYCPSSHLVCT